MISINNKEKLLNQVEYENYLNGFGLEYNDAIINSLMDSIDIELLKSNPHYLANYYPFNKLDKMLLNLDFSLLTNTTRIMFGLLATLDSDFNFNGSTLLEKETIIQNAIKQLKLKDADKTIVESVFIDLVAQNQIKEVSGYYTSRKLYEMELFIFRELTKNSKISKGVLIDKYKLDGFIRSEEARIGFTLSDKQRDFIRLANNQFNVMYLNGFAGAGKTTSSQSVLALFEQKYGRNSIVCCALSGVAANRAKNVTGYNGSTLHSLLGYDGEKFSKNENNQLTQSVIMLDEAGMVSSELMFNLLKAINFSHTTLLIVGDSAQLQSIDVGDVYGNILEKNLCKGITLDKVYRQREDQVINLVAQSIRLAQLPKYQGTFEDFVFIGASGENIITEIESVAKKYVQQLHMQLLNDDFKGYIESFQIIAPTKKKALGTHALNNVLQAIFNRGTIGDEVQIKTDEQDNIIKARDKVIHQKNQIMRTMTTDEFMIYSDKGVMPEKIVEQKVFNGQIGVVMEVNRSFDNYKGGIFVYYPDNDYVAIYTTNDISRYLLIDLAYAITVHKSQGSQYKTVVMPMAGQYHYMLNNKLTYTAITRAKDMLYVIGEHKAFMRGCTNKDEIYRNTVLSRLH